MSIRFSKYHALGNDYLVLAEPRRLPLLDGPYVKRLCDRHRGVGADGVLAIRDADGCIGVTIWNADGSLAEKSGNGLRIFSKFLWDEGYVERQPIRIATAGGDVRPVICTSPSVFTVSRSAQLVDPTGLALRIYPATHLNCAHLSS